MTAMKKITKQRTKEIIWKAWVDGFNGRRLGVYIPPLLLMVSELAFFSPKCPVVVHWKYLNTEQRSKIREAALERDMKVFERKFPLNPDGTRPEGARKPSRKAELSSYGTMEFIA